ERGSPGAGVPSREKGAIGTDAEVHATLRSDVAQIERADVRFGVERTPHPQETSLVEGETFGRLSALPAEHLRPADLCHLRIESQQEKVFALRADIGSAIDRERSVQRRGEQDIAVGGSRKPGRIEVARREKMAGEHVAGLPID